MLIIRIMVFFFALSLISALFVNYTSNAVLLTAYTTTNSQITSVYTNFSNAMQSLSQGNGVLDILGAMAWGVWGAIFTFLSIPGIVGTFVNETIAVLGITNFFITTLVNVISIVTAIYVYAFMVEIIRPGTTGITSL